MDTEKIHETLEMSILPCPPPVKIGLVAVCTPHVVANSQKKCPFWPLCPLIIRKKIRVAKQKNPSLRSSWQ